MLRESYDSELSSHDSESLAERSTAQWLDAARGGSRSALGRAFESCRGYLLLVANDEVPADIGQKQAASDLVQQTLVEALQAFQQFGGRSDLDLKRWLRRLLLNNLIDATRSYRGTGKRDIAREVSLDFDDSNDAMYQQLVSDVPSPSAALVAREEHSLVLKLLDQLPENYSRVIRLRNLEGRSVSDIAVEMGLSYDSTRKLWERAVQRLANELKSCHDT